ncbi:hypothetical protein IE81DRAFT_67421 [Ceraceosorus guamensis]|uniref:Uncharacterized protein n=1 Tax=Ceraceosorus guamensis TaxID=1522189 RepID=A0A316W1S5_9BASI|nr:hypothetical protein IE81DRAFT_67421 [Ceraceosorus guamensis]PWN43740.1 hypothetical protein IE81DRAFT_67421 [Ceraceosorus guamensis]
MRRHTPTEERSLPSRQIDIGRLRQSRVEPAVTVLAKSKIGARVSRGLPDPSPIFLRMHICAATADRSATSCGAAFTYAMPSASRPLTTVSAKRLHVRGGMTHCCMVTLEIRSVSCRSGICSHP